MQIQADRFLALTAMLAGFVPTGPGVQGGQASERVARAGRATPEGPGERAAHDAASDRAGRTGG